MNIIARFSQSFLTLEESIPFSERELEWVCHGSDLPNRLQSGSWNQLLIQVRRLRDDFPSLGITLLIPTEYTHIRYIDLPRASRHKTAQAVPYLLEENLISDIGDEHIVWSATSDGRRACCIAIRHSIMQMLHSLLQASDLHTRVLLPDALPLLQAECWGLTVPCGERALLVDRQSAVCLPLKQLPALSADQIPDTVHLCANSMEQSRHAWPDREGSRCEEPGGEDLNRQTPDHPWPDHVQINRHPDFFALLRSSPMHAAERFNLLRGPYALRSDNAHRHRMLRHAVMGFLAVWAVHIGSDAMLARHYAEKARIEHQQAQALYSEYFPSEPYPANLARHLDAMARDLRNKQRPPIFLSRYTPLIDALDSADMLDSVKPIDIHYNARTDLLNATLRVPSVAFAEQVVEAIERSGQHVRLIAANDAADSATLRITLSGSGSPGQTD